MKSKSPSISTLKTTSAKAHITTIQKRILLPFLLSILSVYSIADEVNNINLSEPKKAENALVITVRNQVLHSLNPRLFGQFMERPAFDGEIGAEAAVVQGTHQLQPQVEQLIREMQIPVLRFPGGTDVDFLDWTDMVDHVPGRKSNTRPISAPRGNKVSNNFGYDEFLQMCERNGSEAIIVVNLRDGLLNVRPLEEAAAHAAALVAYCNGTLDQTLPESLFQWVRLRIKNGHSEPYRVKYIQLGNETWMFNPAVEKTYTTDPLERWHQSLRTYIKAIQAVDPTVKIILDAQPLPVVADIHKEFKDSIYGYAVHAYKPWGITDVKKDGKVIDRSKLTAEEIWNAWVAVPAMDNRGQSLLEENNFKQARALGYKISMTEWNWNGWWDKNGQKTALDSLLAKGIGAASYLHAIMRQGDIINIGLQSMLVGSHWPITSISVDKDNKRPAYMMPSGMVTKLYSQNHGDQMLAVDLANAEFYQQPYKMGQLDAAGKTAYVDVLATRSADTLTVHMINRRFQGQQTVTIDCTALNVKPQKAKLIILDGRLNDNPIDGDSLEPAQIRHETVSFNGNLLNLNLPPRAIIFTQFSL